MSNQRSRGRKDEDPIRAASVKMSWVLRHQAHQFGLSMEPDGFVLCQELIEKGNLGIGEEQVLQIVEKDLKGRFGIKYDLKNRLWIRANQGHSTELVQTELLLTKIDNAENYPFCIHGTTSDNWEKIKQSGLCRMSRNEIHFAKDEFGKVQSGYRSTSQVLIYLNFPFCLENGIPFFESQNGVLLSPGLGDKGIIPTGFFQKVITKTGENLPFEPRFETA